MTEVAFTVYTEPAPQGSLRAITSKVTGKAFMKSDNKKTMPYRHDVTLIARREMADRNTAEPMAGKHVPVELHLLFTLARPVSLPKRRWWWPAVKPDLDKLTRATKDALKGVLYVDDGQVVDMHCRKIYGDVPQVQISARIITENP